MMEAEAQPLQMQAKEHRALPRSHTDARKKQKSVPYGVRGSLIKKITFLKFPDFRFVKLCFYCHKPFSFCHFNMPSQVVTCNTNILNLFSDLMKLA